MEFMDKVLMILIAVSLTSAVTGFFIGRLLERIEWSKLIQSGKINKPKNNQSAPL